MSQLVEMLLPFRMWVPDAAPMRKRIFVAFVNTIVLLTVIFGLFYAIHKGWGLA